MLNGIVMKMMMVMLRWNYQQLYKIIMLMECLGHPLTYKIIMLMECPGHPLTALGQVVVASFTLQL